ncbi:protein kinase family protein [Lederbergia citrea]|uniref:protein kinase family protein n=1 Tax=Lederbergia citrea TaxID=2833581 RepID=UPI001BC9C750|nr:protein kinase family protein [Lederbergia citrea]MBS4178982.1 protein kinase family protein [Lederbergia citrea]MBS4205662.1 protein kinase family protein [Lederbergia citrea]
MNDFEQLAKSVIIKYKNKKPELVDYDKSLSLTGVGRSAFVFKIKATNKVMKVSFPKHHYIAQEEADIYSSIQHIDYYPTLHEAGSNYIVIDYIEGYTFFECLTLGIRISEEEIKEVDNALYLARKEGLNPSDIHLRNIFKTFKGEIKMIDVARFRQTKACNQWGDLKGAYRFYTKPFFPKKIPACILNGIAAFYKNVYRKDAIPENVNANS